MLTHWTRDREDGFSLEHIVSRQTQQTAAQFGLFDRGMIKVGLRADLNVIDYERLSLSAPRMHWDLPAGGRRLAQRAQGYVNTICHGQVIVADDELTSARPGRLLRRTMT